MRWKSLISSILVILLCFPSVTSAPSKQEERPGKRIWQASVSYSEKGTRKKYKYSKEWSKRASAQYKLVTYERMDEGFEWEDVTASYSESSKETVGPEDGCTSIEQWDVSGSIVSKSIDKQTQKTWKQAEESLATGKSPTATLPTPIRGIIVHLRPKGVAVGGLILHRHGDKVYVLEEPGIALQAPHPNAGTWTVSGASDCNARESFGVNASIGAGLPEGTRGEHEQREKQMEDALKPQAKELAKQAEEATRRYKELAEKFAKDIPKEPPPGGKPGQKELTPEMMAYLDKIMREAMSGEGLGKDVSKIEGMQEDFIVATLKQAGATELGNRKVIKGSRTWGPAEEEKRGGEKINITRTLTWNFSLVPEEVEAIHGPYLPIVRGETLILDGSRSKGKNLKYEWTFNPKGCPDGLKGNPNARKKGATATVIILCDTDITLMVSDGKNTSQKSLPVVVKAREWRTKILPQINAYLQTVKLCLPRLYLGRNVCALDGQAAFENRQESNHIFHKEPQEVTWEDTGYKIARVIDSDGPFDGWFYVKENLLRIQRAELINRDLNKQSMVYEENKKRGYKKDFDTLIDQVAAHERIHSVLIEEALFKNDPAKKIESMMDPKDKDALKLKIDLNIQEANDFLDKATNDEDNVKKRLKKLGKFNRSGKVLIPLCNTETYEMFQINSFATLGE